MLGLGPACASVELKNEADIIVERKIRLIIIYYGVEVELVTLIDPWLFLLPSV